MGELSTRAVERVNRPAWAELRNLFMRISRALLDPAPDCRGELTTIYVKFMVAGGPSSPVYAVVWLKTAKRLTVGLAMPPGVESGKLGPAPTGTTYQGLTKYFVVERGDSVPDEISQWAALTYRNVLSRLSIEGA